MHENLRNIPKSSHSQIQQSQWRNCGVIIDTGFLDYFDYTKQLFCKLFRTQLNRIYIWIIINCIEFFRHSVCKTNLWNYLPYIVYSLCRISDTGIIMISQRRSHARDSQNHAQIFNNARFVADPFGNLLADLGFVKYQSELVHVITGFKHDVTYIVIGGIRIRQCTRRYAPRVLTDPRGPSLPSISRNAR